MAVIPTTWNPADKAAGVVLTGGNLTATCGEDESVRSTFGATAGKYYWELTYPSGFTYLSAGVATSASNIDTWPGSDAEAWAAEGLSGDIFTNSFFIGGPSVGPPTTTLSVLLDATAKKLKFWADGVDFGVNITLAGSQFYAIVGDTGTITANFGATAFNHTPPAGYEAGFGELNPNANSALAFRAGAPTAVRGPNRTAQAEGALVFESGEPAAQSGFPTTINPSGVAVFAAGLPAAFLRENRTVRPSGVYAVASGSPMALRGMPPANITLTALGARAFASGTPSARNTATVQAQGAAVFAAGTPKTYPVLRAQGVCVAAAGTPKALAGLRVAGAGVFYAGVPSARATAHVQGVCVVRAGVPTTGASAVAQGQGVLAFGAGVPRISGVTVSPRTAVCFRSGTPTINRGATC